LIPGDSINGVIMVAAGGVANGSFPVPSKGITRWKWEHIWLSYSAFAMAILPVGLALVFAPQIISQTLQRDAALAAQVGVCGVLFGAGSMLFGISLPRLGIAITNALVSGVLVFCGSIGPILIGAVHIGFDRFLWLTLGLLLLVTSLILCAGASIRRDHDRQAPLAAAASKGRSVGAVLIAVGAGILSSMINIGFAHGARLAQDARMDGAPPILASIAIWMPVLLGGLIFNVGYPAYLITRRRSWPLFISERQSISGWSRSSFMGVLWFGAILLYGYGASIMGSAGAVYGWALVTSVSILTSNAWGAITGEWRGAGLKAKTLMLISTVLLVISFVILAVKRLPS
jgi:L-rhamnose-H+ transport protein